MKYLSMVNYGMMVIYLFYSVTTNTVLLFIKSQCHYSCYRFYKFQEEFGAESSSSGWRRGSLPLVLSELVRNSGGEMGKHARVVVAGSKRTGKTCILRQLALTQDATMEVRKKLAS